MSLAIIYGAGSTVADQKVALNDFGANQNGVVLEMVPAGGTANQSTFLLGPGVYRVDCQIGADFGSLNTEIGSGFFYLWDETSSVVRSLSSPAYQSYTPPYVGAVAVRNPQLFQMFSRFSISKGTKRFSIRYDVNPASGFTRPDFMAHNVTTPIGGSAVPQRPTQIKIIRTDS